MARTNNLTNFLGDVASAIKEKLGNDTLIPASEFDSKIRDISTGGTYQEKSISIVDNGNYVLNPDQGYDAMTQVNIGVNVSSGELDNLDITIPQSAYYNKYTGNESDTSILIPIPKEYLSLPLIIGAIPYEYESEDNWVKTSNMTLSTAELREDTDYGTIVIPIWLANKNTYKAKISISAEGYNTLFGEIRILPAPNTNYRPISLGLYSTSDGIWMTPTADTVKVRNTVTGSELAPYRIDTANKRIVFNLPEGSWDAVSIINGKEEWFSHWDISQQNFSDWETWIFSIYREIMTLNIDKSFQLRHTYEGSEWVHSFDYCKMVARIYDSEDTLLDTIQNTFNWIQYTGMYTNQAKVVIEYYYTIRSATVPIETREFTITQDNRYITGTDYIDYDDSACTIEINYNGQPLIINSDNATEAENMLKSANFEVRYCNPDTEECYGDPISLYVPPYSQLGYEDATAMIYANIPFPDGEDNIWVKFYNKNTTDFEEFSLLYPLNKNDDNYHRLTIDFFTKSKHKSVIVYPVTLEGNRILSNSYASTNTDWYVSNIDGEAIINRDDEYLHLDFTAVDRYIPTVIQGRIFFNSYGKYNYTRGRI